MGEEKKWVVCVQCMTYNHAPFIEDTMDGFVIQKTSFPYVCCIVDDASTDGEPDVIDKYMKEHFDLYDASTVLREDTDDYNLLFARHRSNINCYFAVFFLKYNHYCNPENKQKRSIYTSRWLDNAEYIAVCEGDDYWIDSNKLQKQVLALEDHPECTMSCCKTIRVSALDNSKGSTIPLQDHIKEGYVTMEDYLKEQFSKGIWTFHTSSYLFNNHLINSFDSEKLKFIKSFPYSDMAHVLWALMNGNVYYLDFIGGCYRVMSGGYNSMIRKDKNKAQEHSQKMVEGLKYFDEITEMRYHKHVMTRIKHIQYYCEIDQGHHLVFLKPYYWSSFNMTFIKSRMRAFLNTIKKTIA